MVRKSVSPEQTQSILRLHRQGLSYVAIGRTVGVNWRTVRSRVRNAEDKTSQEHGRAVLERADVDILREHLSQIGRVAEVLALVVASDPIARLDSAFNAEESTVGLVQEEIFAAQGMLAGSPALATALASALARKVVDALGQHEPQFRHWAAAEEAFRQQANERWKQVVAIAKARGWDIPEQRQALRDALTAEHDLPSREDDLPSDHVNSVIGQLAAHSADLDLKDAWKCSEQARQQFMDSYEDLVLTGRPQGTCRWCPVDVARGG